MKYHNLIWDFDGTLFDSYPHIHAAYLRALADANRTVDADTLMKKLKISFGEAHAYVNPTDEIRARFAEYENEKTFLPEVKLYDGIKALIEDTSRAGVRHYLYTHRDALALEYLADAGILSYFTECVTSDSEAFAMKPKPDSILYLLARHGIEKADCAMIGDREIDVGSGVAAGIDGILFDETGSIADTAARYRVAAVSALRTLLM